MIDRVLTALLAMQRQSWEQGVAAQAALDLGRDDLALSGRADLAWQQVEGHRSRLCRDRLPSTSWPRPRPVRVRVRAR